VRVSVKIGRRGRVDGVELLQSSGHERLDRAAIRSVRLWRFPRDAAGETSVHSFTFELR
jgi:protein TonB